MSNDRSIHSILQTESFIEGSIDREFIAKAFFLPKEVLASGKWKIETIRTCSGKEWQDAEKYLRKNGANICYDPNSAEIIAAARHVGVSVRKHAITGETFVVVKLWYGNVSHQLFNPRHTVTVKGKTGIAAYDKEKN